MTDSPPPAPAPVGTIKPIAELFRADTVALWATTYNVDLALFNGYLLRRLGDAPLNVVVLADRDRLDSSLSAIPSERIDLVQPVNRRWLLRGVRIGSGVFHPKSYLAVTARSARLLVGSGNLSTHGIDRGREVFTEFVSGTALGDAAIRAWRAWMRRFVVELNDTVLAERFSDLEDRLRDTAALTAVVGSPLWHNLDGPLLDQFSDGVLSANRHVDELIVTAPFYDAAGEALGQLVDRLTPDRLRLYLTSTTSVDGEKLAARLARTSAIVTTFAYLPDRFTHAKLIGAITGSSGWLLSGSANLSQAALTLPAGAGNVELAVISELDPTTLRAAFLPPHTEAEERPVSMLTGLHFELSTEDVPELPPVRILDAFFLNGGHIRITTEPSPDATWRLADHEGSRPLAVDGVRASTQSPLRGPLVHLIDHGGATISNHVVVDDRGALQRVLQTGEPTDRGRPSELSAGDLSSPLGKTLEYLHQHLVLDVSDLTGQGAGADTTPEKAAVAAPEDDLWVRLESEKLGRDPRAGTYDRFFRRAANWADSAAEPLIELLEVMRDRSPSQAAPTAPSTGSLLQRLAREPSTGATWSTGARIRVRARNVLRRWATAQTDPRLTWVDPHAPLLNLILVASTLAQLWRYNSDPEAVVELTDQDLEELWVLWFRPFVGTGKADGWLDHIDVEDSRVVGHLRGELARTATALSWLSVRPGANLRNRITAWQPYLRAALDKNLIQYDDDTAEYLTKIGFAVNTDQIETHLLQVLDFVDDDLWCEQRAAALRLTQLTLQTTGSGQKASVRLHVDGIEDPLYDPRTPALIVAVRQYRRVDAVALYSLDGHWRIVVSTGDPLAFMSDLDAPVLDSRPVGAQVLEDLVAAQGVLADLFPAEVLVA